MFKRILKKLSGSPKPTHGEPQLAPQEQVFFDQIQEQSKRDPLVGAKLGAQEVFQRVLAALSGEKGVHAETLLGILGTLAGYACQAQLRAQAFKDGQPESSILQVVTTADGKTWYFGDPLNHLLVGAQYSVLGLAGAAAAEPGVTSFPDPADLFKHTAASVGSAGFGIPRLPAGHALGDSPLHYLKIFWPVLHPTMKRFCPDPAHWPILYGLAAQKAITASKGVLAPDLAFTIVMECAIPMSKVDLANA